MIHIAPRTALLPLEPIALGTEHAESFSNYAMRLARHNGVSPLRMYGASGTKGRPHAVPFAVSLPPLSIQGTDLTTCPQGRILADTLAKLTGIAAVSRLNWFQSDSAVTFGNWTSPHQKWCPECLASDRIPYLRAAWDSVYVKACPIHRTRLAEECTAADCCRRIPHYRHAWTWHCCPKCVRSMSVTNRFIEMAREDQLHVSSLIGRLVAAASSGEIDWANVEPGKGLLAAVDPTGCAPASHVARDLGVDGRTVKKWRAGIVPLDLSTLLAAALPRRLDPVDLMDGKPTVTGEFFCAAPIAPKSHRSPLPKEKLAAAVAAYLARGWKRPIPDLKKLAAELGASARRLEWHFSDFVAQHRQHYRAQRNAKKTEGILALEADVIRAIAEIAASGAVIKGEAVKRWFGKRAPKLISIRDFVRQAVREAR